MSRPRSQAQAKDAGGSGLGGPRSARREECPSEAREGTREGFSGLADVIEKSQSLGEGLRLEKTEDRRPPETSVGVDCFVSLDSTLGQAVMTLGITT